MHSLKLSPGGSVSFLFVLCFFLVLWRDFLLLCFIYILIVALVEQYYGYLMYDFILIIIYFVFL